MYHLSLRGWLFLVSLLFALLVVGGIAITTFIIVSDGMQVVVDETAERLAVSASSVVRDVSADAARDSANASDPNRRAEAYVQNRLADALARGGFTEAGFALYDAHGAVVWDSDVSAVHPEYSSRRARALRTGARSRSVGGRGSLFSGLFTEARLGTVVVHVPTSLWAGEGTLDVTYVPESEDRVIDAIRVPMAILAVSAMLIMVVLMQTSMVWVLNLVDDLRTAADSIDAGQLDRRLPDQAQNEIGDLARSLNRLLERLGRRHEAQARFIADASHELATPVAGIRGYTSILKAWGSEDPKIAAEAVEAIDRESLRMSRLTNDLLSLLHADEGLRLKKERFDLNVIVRERLAVTASKYLEKDIEFIGPEEESLLMVGDPDRMEDVAAILLDNAAKYTQGGGSVTVRTHRRRETVTLTVADTGPGIPFEEQAHVFDRFFRSDKARTQGEGGFGLGLAIAKGMVESMGGTISVSGGPGEGASFQVCVPRGR
jgi:signal transduction histidine kinase